MIRSHGREWDWVEWGVKGKVSGQSRATKVRAAEDQGGKPPGSLRPGGQRPDGPRDKSVQSTPSSPESKTRVLCSEDVYSWWDREKKVTY